VKSTFLIKDLKLEVGLFGKRKGTSGRGRGDESNGSEYNQSTLYMKMS
jgi:hypothetical protein